MLFENIECLTNTYKSGNLSGKLPKNTKCIYIYNYFMLIINDSLDKRFCKKVLALAFLFSKSVMSTTFSQYYELALLKYILFC